MQAIEAAQSVSAIPVAMALERVQIQKFGQRGFMRATDHQFQQSLVVGIMNHQGEPGVPCDVEGSSYGFRVIKTLSPEQAQMGGRGQMRSH